MKVARSSLECRLFIELDVCTCGQTPGERRVGAAGAAATGAGWTA